MEPRARTTPSVSTVTQINWSQSGSDLVATWPELEAFNFKLNWCVVNKKAPVEGSGISKH